MAKRNLTVRLDEELRIRLGKACKAHGSLTPSRAVARLLDLFVNCNRSVQKELLAGRLPADGRLGGRASLNMIVSYLERFPEGELVSMMPNVLSRLATELEKNRRTRT